MAAFSGPAMAMFFGTISPSSTCTVTTIASAIARDSGCSSAGETPTTSNGRRSRSATAGSPSRPSRIDDTVIPSWAPANISGSCSPARMTVTALDLPCSASASNRSRRAEISENSAPTKNALVAISKMVANTPSRSPISNPSHGGITAIIDMGQVKQVDTAAIHSDHPGLPAGRAFGYAIGFISAQLHRVPADRNATELLEYQPADRLVFTLRRVIPGGCRHLVDAQQT